MSAQQLVRFRPDVVLVGHVYCSPPTWPASLTGVPTVLYLHADEVPAHPALTRIALRRATRTIAVSRHTADLARSFGAPLDRLRVIPPGVDLPARPIRPTASEPRIVTVARLEDRYKGHDVMLRALRVVAESVPDVRWTVIGDGSLRSELETQADQLGVRGRVDFVGNVSDDERDALLDTSSVFAMPSRLPPNGGGEGFGIAYMEAAAHGLAVVAGDASGSVDAVEHGRTGLLVDAADHRAVADALTRLLSDGDRAAALGRAGAERAREYAWPSITSRVAAVLDEALAERRRRP